MYGHFSFALLSSNYFQFFEYLTSLFYYRVQIAEESVLLMG